MKNSSHAEPLKLPTSYDPHAIESSWYDFWESEGFFAPSLDSKKPSFCVVIPPPNVTGTLHMGHALPNTLQDVVVRYKRMQGFDTLWVPGTDHAGIATQTVVERNLMASTGKRRKDFSREEFLSHVWEWKEKHENIILNQLKKLGCSCHWDMTRFTMDEGCCLSVRSVFKKLYDQGLIYRGDYLVNWDPVTQTALADDEVEYEEKQGHLWHFSYPLKDGSESVVIATTRPETMLGDTAVAVSPSDPRYKHLIGKTVLLPISNREIPIIQDHHVDPKFGTGVVKITPAHDPNDYQMGLDHNLPMINIMTPDGKINENGGRFEGLSMQKARVEVVKEMQNLGLCTKIDPHTNRVGHSYRSKAIIEPYLSKQWFVKMTEFAPKLKEAVTKDKVELLPKSWENTYFHWIDNLRDWCISRQLWWGHRIPIWYNKEDPSKMICHEGKGLPPEVEKDPDMWEQDEDVLDTWFSSALWPFSVLNWPEKNNNMLERFYPNGVLITGHDILFFWVARMILMGEYVLGEVPFPKTFLHGLIYGKSYWRDLPEGGIEYVSEEERVNYDLEKTPIPKDVHCRWEKMSKSKGNVINPLEVIQEYGTDAIRMGMCVSSPQSREIDLDRRRFQDLKNFTNKIWNGARFVFLNLEGNADEGLSPLTLEDLQKGISTEHLNLEDKWILGKLTQVTQSVIESLDNYSFDKAALQAYDFFWKEFCAYYVEMVKPVLFGKSQTAQHRTNKQRLLVIALVQSLRLLHPFIPFITEELFQRIKTYFNVESIDDLNIDAWTKDCLEALHSPACIVAPFPTVSDETFLAPDIEQSFDFVQKVVYTIRNIRGEMKVPTNSHVDIYLSGSKEALAPLEEHLEIVKALVKINEIHLTPPKESLFASEGSIEGIHILIPLPENLKEQEKSRLEKEQKRLEEQVEKGKKQLENKAFTQRAPEKLVNEKKATLLEQENKLKDNNKKLLMLS
jgi:valyl-tRNA synthetase